MVVLTVLIASISGCSRQTKHEVLTFFFTGVPPLEEEKKPETEKEKSAEETKIKKKVTPRPKKLFNHTPYRLKMCDQCHQTSAFFGRFRKKASPVIVTKGRELPGMLVIPLKELCIKCHEYVSASKVFKEGLWLHAPAAQGKCTLCHGSHQSEHPKLLLEKLDKICTQCHSKGFMMDTADHRKSTECLSCHNPHLGKDRMLLSKDYKEVKQPVAPLPWDVQTKGSAVKGGAGS
jgi:predicted CXXCH cytochrome family protein